MRPRTEDDQTRHEGEDVHPPSVGSRRRRSDRGSRVLPSPVTRAFAVAFAALLFLAPRAAGARGSADGSSRRRLQPLPLRADPDTWIVGAVPNTASAKIAKQSATRRPSGCAGRTGGYAVARSTRRARSRTRFEGQASAGLRPGQRPAARPQRIPDDPLSTRLQQLARDRRRPDAHAAAGHAAEPADRARWTPPDLTHPEWTGDRNVAARFGGAPVDNPHGTATLSVAAAAERDRHPRRVARGAGAQRRSPPERASPGGRGDHLRVLGRRDRQGGRQRRLGDQHEPTGRPRAARPSGCRSTSRMAKGSSRSRPRATSSRTATRSSSRLAAATS